MLADIRQITYSMLLSTNYLGEKVLYKPYLSKLQKFFLCHIAFWTQIHKILILMPYQIFRQITFFRNPLNLEIQLGQPSVTPPRLVLEVGGTSTLQAAMPGELKSPPPTWKLEVGGTSTLQA